MTAAAALTAGYLGAGQLTSIGRTATPPVIDGKVDEACYRNTLPVTFLIDRAGLVGEDGETHQGVFDLSYLRSVPGLVVAAPRDVRDLKKLVEISQDYDGPMAIRYPKSCEDMGPGIQSQQRFSVGEWELLSDGRDAMIFAVGRMVPLAMQAAIELMGKGVSAGVVDARFVAPMDMDMLRKAAAKVRLVVTVEENVLAGGFGEGVLEALSDMGVNTPVMALGVPDRFIAQATVAEQTLDCGLDPYSIARRIRERLAGIEEAGQ